MEIWSYLWSRRYRIAVLVLLPVLVGAGTFFYVRSTSGPQVEGALELTLPTGGTTGVTDAQIANFVSVAQGDGVRKALSDQFGVSRGYIQGHLTVTRVDTSGTYVRVAYISHSPKNVAAMVTAAAGQALGALLDPDIAAAKATRAHLLAQYAAVGHVPKFQAALIHQGLTRRQLIQRKQGLLLDQIGALNQQISLATAQRKAAESAATDQSAVTLSRTSANSIALKTAVVNAGIALFAAIILLVAYDTVRPRRTYSEDGWARPGGDRRSPSATEHPQDPSLWEEPDESELWAEPDQPDDPQTHVAGQHEMDLHGHAGAS